MKTLSEHFLEIINFLDINQESIDLAHLKISELNNQEIKSIFQKGGNIVDGNDLIKCEEEIREFTLSNKIYKICVRKINRNKTNTEYYIINFYSPSVECVILQIKLKEKKAYLTELLKQEGCLMKKNKNNYDNYPKETGELLVEIIIKICESFNLEEIELTDNSYILCKNNPNARINLLYSKMILDGDTWYGKFGFEPVEQINKDIYIKNKENYNKNILTKEIRKDYFIKEINNKEKYVQEIKKISNKYEEMKEKKLCDYMRWISENYCTVYSEIYEYIYKKAGYKKYSSLKFTLRLKSDLSEFVNMIKL